jgi:SNF2 family DNA or RNA helicase
MPTSLYPYQEIGAKWLTGKPYALLADEMGLGKSAQVIVACDLLCATNILVLCPAIVRFQWEREFQNFSRWTRKLSVILHGKTIFNGGSGVTICSYDLAIKPIVNTWICQKAWDVVVFDECHYLTNRNARRTDVCFRAIGPQANYLWALSGTPAPNHGGELYPLLRAFGAWHKGYWSFVRRFCITRDTVYGTQIMGTKNIQELRGLLRQHTLRRKVEDVLPDLPTIQFSNVVVEPSPVDLAKWYPEVTAKQKTEAEQMDEIAKQQAVIDSIVSQASTGAQTQQGTLEALAHIAVGVTPSRRYCGLTKTPAVAELIAGELQNGAYSKIVIFAIHRDVIVDLQDRLKQFRPVVIFGGTPAEKRKKFIHSFQTDPRTRVFIGNIQAAGIGIDLFAANQVAMVEASWVPSQNSQAVMRVHRIGQTRPVNVRFFSVVNSTDEFVQRVCMRKTRDLTAILDSPVITNPFED